MVAATGNISPDELEALKAHLEDCATCRGTFADMAEIHANWLPERPGFEIFREQDADLRHRDAIHRALAKEGVHFSRAARRRTRTNPNSLFALPLRRRWLLVAVCMLMFCLSAALVLRAWHFSAPLPPVAFRVGVPVPVPVYRETLAAPGPSQADLKQQISEARAAQAGLRQQLLAEEERVASLKRTDASATVLINHLKQQLAAAHTAQQRAEGQVAELRYKQDVNDTIALVQQTEIQKLNKKLTDQAASLERERQVLSLGGREVRDLIAARNLHIIDVYDTDGKGKTSAVFGRIFYTEGKSLIFYAYDLNGKQADNGRSTFYVWGKRDGDPHDVKGLGALAKDDNAQKRWVFTTTDTKILASIDSVFVTTEPTGKPSARPKGRPLLSAYLGTAANHP